MNYIFMKGIFFVATARKYNVLLMTMRLVLREIFNSESVRNFCCCSLR